MEQQAVEAELKGGKYIRPIVLFQAQPRTSDDSETFDKIKDNLVEMGIPAEQIKIKTAGKDELKDIDLMSRDCPVRYTITVNALKEGWDCPFAYILASLANRTSKVDVEQILGRILRLPYTKESDCEFLNMGYVIRQVSALGNVEFWHRNLERGKGFYINGNINHYPDFIVRLKSGITVLTETKDDDRDNSDSEEKLCLGKAWETESGKMYRYYMVFDHNDNLDGAITLPELIDRIGRL